MTEHYFYVKSMRMSPTGMRQRVYLCACKVLEFSKTKFIAATQRLFTISKANHEDQIYYRNVARSFRTNVEVNAEIYATFF